MTDICFYTRQGTVIATGFTGRIVVSGRDDEMYYEFEEKDIVKDSIKQKYRGRPEPGPKAHYIWWVSRDDNEIKIYEQQWPVQYADYKCGKWYINVTDVFITDSIETDNFKWKWKRGQREF